LQQLSATKALTAEQKKQAILKKSQGILDIEQAGILAGLQGKISENERLRLELQLALLTGNTKEADRLSNELLMSQARTTGLATFIANLPKALNPFADYPDYVLKALAELAKLSAGIKSVQISGPSVPMFQQDVERSELLSNMAREDHTYGDLMSKYANTNKAPATIIQNNYISGATQGLLDELNNGLINNSASGTTSSLNRLGLIGP
jgi:hypothetical protein